MSSELIINASLPETRIALMENGEIQELLIERASGKGIVGNIYKGRVTRVLPGMQAAFVDIGLEKAAFLYVDDVYVHSEIWEEEEGPHQGISPLADVNVAEADRTPEPVVVEASEAAEAEEAAEALEAAEAAGAAQTESTEERADREASQSLEGEASETIDEDGDLDEEEISSDDDDEDEDDPRNPVEMSADPSDSDRKSKKTDQEPSSDDQPAGTLAAPKEEPSSAEQMPLALDQSGPPSSDEFAAQGAQESEAGDPSSEEAASEGAAGEGESSQPRKRHRRGRRGGRFRKRNQGPENAVVVQPKSQESYPESYKEHVADSGEMDSDRAGLDDEQALAGAAAGGATAEESDRPNDLTSKESGERRVVITPNPDRANFRAPRARDRRIRQKTTSTKTFRAQINIQDLLREGQEVLVQVAKDPIATKGARLTCHISLPGRHLVCMPTIDHVGVSRRIEKEDERRRLREYVERNRPRNLGFIVRTASGKQQSEKRIKQDIDYLTRLWSEIKEKAANVTAPALVYEDLNAVLRAVRDWVTEEIDKVIVDSRYHFNEVQRFVSHFMPPLKQKVELYHGDIPIFDAYGISTELSRALERKVWLKSGGYIVIDQAEALVAIDVNTGRYVGKKNLEDTILKTNLEAVQEIAYQLRLRNCGGIIILDLIDMEKEENKQRVYRALEDALMRDRARPTIQKISELGLIEMTRKRTRDTIIRTLCESCTHCEGKGFIKSKQTVAYEVMREIEREGIERDVGKILVQAHPDVIDILAIDERETLDQLERRYRKLIYLQAITDFHPEQFEVTADKRPRSERSDRPERPERSHDTERPTRHPREKHRHEEAPAPTIVAIKAVANVAASMDGVSGQGTSQPIPVPQSQASLGNGPAQENQGGVAAAPTASSSQSDDFFDEEDRLAFLRAQAAQDAALARLGNSSTPTTRASLEGAPSRGGRDHRRNNRGKKGGKFRRGSPDRNRDRGPKPYTYGPTPKWTEPSNPPGPVAEHLEASEPAESEKAKIDTPKTPVSGGAGGNGGSGHSQPPV